MRGEHRLTRSELALEFSEIFNELDSEDFGELIDKNVPLETLEFFRNYGPHPENLELTAMGRHRAPNLMLLGYLVRVLEERLLSHEPLDS